MGSHHFASALRALRLTVAFALLAPGAGAEPQAFASAQEAARALVDACRTNDTEALRRLVDPDRADAILELDDPGTARRRAAFAAGADNHLVLREDGPDRVTLVVGFRAYPFPVPIVRTERGWLFNAEEGYEELLDRTIGWNELTAISLLRDYGEAQLRYASEPRDGTRVRQFAKRFRSTPGTRDGLYWEVEEDSAEEPSPFGPLVTEDVRSAPAGTPYYGYHYRILTAQGPNAPGGAYSYVINGNLVAGFAAVAWPAKHGRTGVMTFLVNHYGDIYEKDLGPDTEPTAAAFSAYDPDDTWSEAE
jgi:hypothetical protein